MSYRNTFITVSEDTKATAGTVPMPRNGKPTVASIEYELISAHPYTFTEKEVQFQTYLIKKGISVDEIGTDELEALRLQFFAKPKPCFRASPLVKQFGWGIHYDRDGKVALYGVDSDEYQKFVKADDVVKLKGMRSKRN